MQDIYFSPLIPKFWLGLLLGLGLVIILLHIFSHKRAALFRLFAFALLTLILLNPIWQQKIQTPLKSVVAIVIDKSESQKIGNRSAQSTQALNALKQKFQANKNITLRIIESKNESLTEQSATELISLLSDQTADIPPARLAGAILITDGQVHDIPKSCKSLNFPAPINALITGHPNEFDRKIELENPPKFGLVHKKISLNFTIKDYGPKHDDTETIPVSILINGKIVQNLSVKQSEKQTFQIALPHIGQNIVEIKTPVLKDEISGFNNHAVAIIQAIKENMRVLLVSGEPYNGERLWRNLLKSDPNIDLVHFTILRSMEKMEYTPLNELALVAFPATDLFVHKIDKFDLIILDRYQNYNILPKIYYDFMTRYVENGGALLMITGPEFSGHDSLMFTPLANILPASPTGKILEKAFTPSLTAKGKKHPITRDLIEDNQKKWGHWFRQIDVNNLNDNPVLLNGADDAPLLIVNKVQKGRIALFLSDESWLWARGFEGGGPYAMLYRNMAHWLMGDLKEEDLKTHIQNGQLYITRQTMKDSVEPAQIITPSGEKMPLPLKQKKPGLFSNVIRLQEFGLYSIHNENLDAAAYYGPLNAPEFADMLSTTNKLTPLCACSKGNIFRLQNENDAEITLPDIRLTNNLDEESQNKDVILLHKTTATNLLGLTNHSIFTDWYALLLSLFAFLLIWLRESK